MKSNAFAKDLSVAPDPERNHPKNLRWKIAQRFELLWWKRYLRGRSEEEYLEWKKKYWQDFLLPFQERLSISKDHKILDAGCGPAGIFIELSDKAQVEALDPLLNHYQQSLPHFNYAKYPNVNFHNLALEDFNPGHPFDIIFCINALNHVSDINKSLIQLNKFLKKGGILVFTSDAHNHQWIKRVFRTFQGDILHPHQYDRKEYTELLSQQGFEVKDTKLIKKERIFSYYLMLAEKVN